MARMTAGHKRRWFQVSLKTILIEVAAICAGLAAIKADYLGLAICVAFPFTIGLAIGDTVRNGSASLLITLIAPSLVVPLLWGIIGHVVWPDPNFSFLRSVLSSLMMAPAVLGGGIIQAFLGNTLARWLNRKSFVSENPELD
jgi:hypothetical protein